MHVLMMVHRELRKQGCLPVSQASRAMPSGHLPPLLRHLATTLHIFNTFQLFPTLFLSHDTVFLAGSTLQLCRVVDL